MLQIHESNIWQVELERGTLPDGVYKLTVAVADSNDQIAEDCIRLVSVRRLINLYGVRSETRRTLLARGLSAGSRARKSTPIRTGESGRCSLTFFCP
jgi:hypothetical protein